jgi:hypothetical protein
MKKEMAASFFLACAVVVGVLWLLRESDERAQNQNKNTADAQAKDYSSQPTDQADRTSSSGSKSNLRAQADHVGQGRVVKCTVNGKTIYSDEGCPTGAKTQHVQINDTAGIISPPKAVLAELTAQRHAAENDRTQSMQQSVSPQAQSNKIECDSLNKHIESLDSMSRQAQSGQTQDWIRQERQQARERQYRIHC